MEHASTDDEGLASSGQGRVAHASQQASRRVFGKRQQLRLTSKKGELDWKIVF